LLSGANTYTGATNVNAGTLQLTGSALSTSGVTVSGGAKLDLAGLLGSSLAATTAVANNGTLEVSSTLAQNVGAVTEAGTTQVDAGKSLTATSILQGTLTIGAGATVTIRATTAGAGLGNMSQVPEPSSFALLGAGITGLLAYAWRRRKPTGV